ncbi:MAG: HAD-IIIA family hydrolase [Nanoarchaeota archaeon]|nr:HAD-IIIA family hydrolase [Nanoarchaeota archaeon]
MTKIRQAVILAGGLGTRLRPLTDTLPKPMVEFYVKPFVMNLIEMLKKQGITDFVFLVGYLNEKVQEYFGDGSKFGISIKYSVGPVEWDTGKRVKAGQDTYDKHFLLCYCDNYVPINLKKLIDFYDEKKVKMSVLIYTNKEGFTKSNMKVNDNGLVTVYDKKRQASELSGVDIGFFIVDKKIVETMSDNNISFQETILNLIAEKQLAGYLTDHRYCGLSNNERLPLVKEFLRPKKVIFIDRDGVINVKAPKADYVKTWKEFKFLPDALDAMELLVKKGYEMYIISNQAGIAREKMTHDDLADIHKHMLEEMAKKGIEIKQIYYCPHGWDEGCECRKPKPGMFYIAAREHQIDLSKTTFIGDDERDGIAAEAADIPFYMVDENNSFLDVVKVL